MIHENKISVRSRKINSTGEKKRPKLDNARRLRIIYQMALDDLDFEEIFKRHAMKFWSHTCYQLCHASIKKTSMVFPQMQQCDGHRRKAILCQEKDHKTIYEHKIEAHESRRCHIQESEKRGHEDHVAKNSLKHYNRLRQSIRFLQAMKMPDERAAVDKEWGRWRNLPAWRESKPNSKEEVFEQAQKE